MLKIFSLAFAVATLATLLRFLAETNDGTATLLDVAYVILSIGFILASILVLLLDRTMIGPNGPPGLDGKCTNVSEI